MIDKQIRVAVDVVKNTWQAVWSQLGVFVAGCLLFGVEFYSTSLSAEILKLDLGRPLFFGVICCLHVIAMVCLLPFSAKNGVRNDIQELIFYDLMLHLTVLVLFLCMSKQDWPGLALIPSETWVDWHLGTAYVIANGTIQYLKFARLLSWREWPVFGLIGLVARAQDKRAGVPFLAFVSVIAVAAWMMIPVKLVVKEWLCWAVLAVLLVRVALDLQRRFNGLLEEINRLRRFPMEPANDRFDLTTLPLEKRFLVEGLIAELSTKNEEEIPAPVRPHLTLVGT